MEITPEKIVNERKRFLWVLAVCGINQDGALNCATRRFCWSNFQPVGQNPVLTQYLWSLWFCFTKNAQLLNEGYGDYSIGGYRSCQTAAEQICFSLGAFEGLLADPLATQETIAYRGALTTCSRGILHVMTNISMLGTCSYSFLSSLH
jgi:hypothetical protein